MKSPDKPADESDRLDTLRSIDILDTPPDERFDRLTRMARKIFDVPIALVSLVDADRQWFKSSAGLEASETPRDISFCGHAILGDEVFMVPNVSDDERFSDNPLVTGDPNISFYAGCPLRALDGQKLGTLCIIDRKPRVLDESDVEVLSDLAAIAESELAAVQMATVDDLTNIANRRGFNMLAQYSLDLCLREKIPASLVFVDLDGFKSINDTFGHAAGDEALTMFADLLKSAGRVSDIPGRLGGDEFVVLLTNAARQFALHVMERLTKSIQKHNREAGREYDIAFSYGVVEYDCEKHASVDDLLAEGDALMFEAKNKKK